MAKSKSKKRIKKSGRKATTKGLQQVLPKKKTRAKTVGKVVLLSGGNPQIAKGEGDAPVQAYISAMPGWKRAAGKQLDMLITENIPGVYKAVKWNSPFYGFKDDGWFISFHCFAKYIKVAFFKGTSLRPMPPEESKVKNVRYLNIYEDGISDQKQLTTWIKQASKLPGERM